MISFRRLGFAAIVATTFAVGGCCAPAPVTTITAAWNVNCPAGCPAVNNPCGAPPGAPNCPLSGTLGTSGTFDAYGSCSVGPSGTNRVLNVEFLSGPSSPPNHGIYIYNAVFSSVTSPATSWGMRVFYNSNEYDDDQTSRHCTITVTSINGTTVAGTFACLNITGVAGGPRLNVCADGDSGCTGGTTGTFSVTNCTVN